MSNEIVRIPTPMPVPFSKAVKAGGFIFVSGQLAMDANANIIDGDITVQTRVVLERIAATLVEAGVGILPKRLTRCWLHNPKNVLDGMRAISNLTCR